MPNAKFLAGFWMLAEDGQKVEEWRAAVGAEFAAVTLTEAVAICVRESMQPGAREGCGGSRQAGGSQHDPLVA